MPGPTQGELDPGGRSGQIGENPFSLEKAIRPPLPVDPFVVELVFVGSDGLEVAEQSQPESHWSNLNLFPSFDLIAPDKRRPSFTLVTPEDASPVLESHSPFSELADWFRNLPASVQRNVSGAIPAAVGLMERHSRSLRDEAYYAAKLAALMRLKAHKTAREIGEGISEFVIYPDRTAQRLGSTIGSVATDAAQAAEYVWLHPKQAVRGTVRVLVPAAVAAGTAFCSPPPDRLIPPPTPIVAQKPTEPIARPSPTVVVEKTVSGGGEIRSGATPTPIQQLDSLKKISQQGVDNYKRTLPNSSKESYNQFEMTFESDDGKFILGLSYILTTASEGLSAQDIGNGQQLLGGVENADLYFWSDYGKQRAFRVDRPDPSMGEVKQAIFDQWNNQMLFVVEKNSKLVTYTVNLQGENAGKLNPVFTAEPTKTPKPTDISVESRFPVGIQKTTNKAGETVFVIPGVLDMSTGENMVFGKLDVTGQIIEYKWLQAVSDQTFREDHSLGASWVKGSIGVNKGDYSIITEVYKDSNNVTWLKVRLSDGTVGWISPTDNFTGKPMVTLSKPAQELIDKTLIATPAPTKRPEPTATRLQTFEDIYGAPVFKWVSPSNLNVDGSTDWNSANWTTLITNGGDIRMVQDEAFGQVAEYRVTQDLPSVRIQIGKDGPPIRAPFAIKFFVKIGTDMSIASGGGINLLTVINGGPKENPSLLAGLDFGSSLVGVLRVKMPPGKNPDPKGNPGNNYKEYRGGHPLRPGGWDMIEFRVAPDGKLEYWLNGSLEASGYGYKSEEALASGIKPTPEEMIAMHARSMYGSKIAKNSSLRGGPVEIVQFSQK